MTTPVVRLRRSATQGAVPTTAQLALGEVAINTYDGKLFLKKDNGTESIVEVGGATPTEHKILDDISGSFNGVSTQFTISSSSTNFINTEITNAARLLISVGGVIQQPDPTQTSGYYITGGTNISTDPIKVNFVEAPKAGQAFFGVAYGLTINPTAAFSTAEQSISYSIMFGV